MKLGFFSNLMPPKKKKNQALNPMKNFFNVENY
jgi:hypothetical protein